MNNIEEFNIVEARKLKKDIRNNLFYIHVKKLLRKHIMEDVDTDPLNQYDCVEPDNDDYYYEENEHDIKINIPVLEKLKNMFKLDGFDVEISFEIVSYEEKPENVIDKIFRKVEGSRNIKIHIKDTWSEENSFSGLIAFKMNDL